LLNAAWKKFWAASIALAALSGFFYGWRQRSENPPFVITRRTEAPPETKLLRKGRYEEAAKVVLESIKDEKKEYFKYQSVAVVYAARALRDPTNREKWAGQAALYIDKSVSLAPTDSINLLEADCRDRVPIFDPRNVAPKQTGSLFDIALRELLLLAHITQAVSNNHGQFPSSGSAAHLNFNSELGRASRKIRQQPSRIRQAFASP
jgi:hypothetical protein